VPCEGDGRPRGSVLARARYQTADALLIDLEQLTSEHGLFVSAFMVGKYMREMFPEEAQQLPHVEADEVDTADTNTLDPENTLATQLLATQTTPLMDPAAPTPRPSDPSPEFRVVFRAAPAGTEDISIHDQETPVPQDDTPIPQVYAGFDEYSTLSGYAKTEETSSDFLPPIDPIATRAADILSEIDPDLIDDRDISLSTLNELVVRAGMWSDLGDVESAIIAIDLVLSADRAPPGVLDLLAKNYAFMTTVYENYVGERERAPRIARAVEPNDPPLDRRAAYLLSLVESSITVAQLLDRSEMPQVEAYRHLSQLLLRKLVVLEA
jgi:hypothetical protein